MHLLFVVPAYAPFVGGAQTLCRALARRLVAAGHQVSVLTTAARTADDFWLPPDPSRTALPWREKVEGVQIVRVPLAYPWPAPYRFGVLRRWGHALARLPLPGHLHATLLRHFTRSMPPLPGLQSEMEPLIERADVVQVVDAGWDGLFVGAARAAFARRIPVMALPLIHTGSPAILGHFSMAHQVAVYRQAGAAIALSTPEAGLLQDWGVPSERIHRIAPGVDPVAGDDDAAPATLPAHLPGRYLLFLGAATYDKGAFALAQSVVALARLGIDVAVVYAGPQQHRLGVFIDTQPSDVRAILKERLHLLGVVDEARKRALLAGCVALVLPSRVDSFGIVLLEAWQQGKPVVTADVGGPAALVRHEETGLLVPFDDPSALSAALKRILTDADLAARLGAAGRQTVKTGYTWDKCYDVFYQIAVRLRPTADGPHPIGRNNERL